MLAGLAYPAPPLAGCTREGDEDGLCGHLDVSSSGRSVEVGACESEREGVDGLRGRHARPS